MTDKPKRKRTPNRRRQFLLMVILPILALMAGFIALKPQMDAWLATDPFTPQCQFEEDRFFHASGHIADVNGKHDWRIPLHPYFHVWSTDGTMFAYLSQSEARPQQMHMLDLATGEDQHIEIADHPSRQVFTWSPDWQWLATTVKDDNRRDVSLVIVSRDLSDVRYFDGFATIWGVVWSPDSEHIIIQQVPSVDHDSDLLLELKTGTHTPMSDAPDYWGVINWLNDGEILYQTGSHQMFVYDIEDGSHEFWADVQVDAAGLSNDRQWMLTLDTATETQSAVYHLPAGNTPLFTLPQRSWGVFVDHTFFYVDDDFTYFYDLETIEMIELRNLQFDEPERTSYWTRLSPSNTYARYEIIRNGKHPDGDGIVHIETQEEITLPENLISGTTWLVLDGEEWLNYSVPTETDDPQVINYLHHLETNQRCKTHIFDEDRAFVWSWQPEPQG